MFNRDLIKLECINWQGQRYKKKEFLKNQKVSTMCFLQGKFQNVALIPAVFPFSVPDFLSILESLHAIIASGMLQRDCLIAWQLHLLTVVRRDLQSFQKTEKTERQKKLRRKTEKALDKYRKNSNRNQSMLQGKLFSMAAAGAASEVALLCNENKICHCAQSHWDLTHDV